MAACCGPSRDAAAGSHRPEAGRAVVVEAGRREPPRGMARIPGGTFWMGGDDPDGSPEDGEGPVRRCGSSPFWIDRDGASPTRSSPPSSRPPATSRRPSGSAGRSSSRLLARATSPPTRAVAAGALVAPGRRRRLAPPGGPGLHDRDRHDHPVVHVSWHDAGAYARLGRQAPADRGRVGVRRPRRPGAGALPLGRRARRPAASTACNIWQGTLPDAQHRRRRLRRHRARSTPSRPTATASTTWPATSGSGAPTGSARPSTSTAPPRPDGPADGRRQGRCAAAPTSATTPTATATGWPRAAPTRPTARPATSGFRCAAIV